MRKFSSTQLRVLQGEVSPEALASAAGVSRWTFDRWCRGEVEPRASQAAAIADALGVPIDHLYDADPPEAEARQ